MPPVLIELAIEPKSRADQEKLHQALGRLVKEDPTFRVSTDPETGQTVIKGETEHQLELVIERLQREFGIAINVGGPQVAYRETLGRRSEVDYAHKKQSGGSGQFARIKVVFEPGAPGSGYSFESKIIGGSIPKEFIPGVEKGLAASRETGVLAGFPVIDFKATLVDGNYHDVDSSVLAFETPPATRSARASPRRSASSWSRS
jgi:elongation factor G